LLQSLKRLGATESSKGKDLHLTAKNYPRLSERRRLKSVACRRELRAQDSWLFQARAGIRAQVKRKKQPAENKVL